MGSVARSQLLCNLIFSSATKVDVPLEVSVEALQHVIQTFPAFGRGCLFNVSVEGLGVFVLEYLLVLLFSSLNLSCRATFWD